jgi:hypothetical protein
MDEKYRKTDTETLVAAVSSAVSELAANDLMTGKDWLRTIKKQDLQVIKTSIEVVRTFSLQTDEILSSLERDLDPLLTENVENSVRPGKEGSLKDMQRRQRHLHMIRNLNPRNQTHAFAIVVASCHRYRNFGCSPSDYGRRPTNPESQMRKSVTTVTGGRSITHEEVPEVVAILSLYPSFEALFEDIETLSGAGLKMKEKTSSQIFFTRVAIFEEGLTTGPAADLDRAQSIQPVQNVPSIVEQCPDKWAREAANESIRYKNGQKKKKKRKNSQWQNRNLQAATTWNSSVRSPVERKLINQHFHRIKVRLEAENDLCEKQLREILIDLQYLMAIVLARDPITLATSSIHQMGILLETYQIEKKIRYPKERFKPSGNSKSRYRKVHKTLRISIPPILADILALLVTRGAVSTDFCLSEYLDLTGESLKKAMKTRKRILLDAMGIPRIGMDQWAQQLPIYMNDCVDGVDEGMCSESTPWVTYCLIGGKQHLPPVGSHYEAPSGLELSSLYALYVESYFSGRL